MIYDTLAFRTIVKRVNDAFKLELELDLLWFYRRNFAEEHNKYGLITNKIRK